MKQHSCGAEAAAGKVGPEAGRLPVARSESQQNCAGLGAEWGIPPAGKSLQSIAQLGQALEAVVGMVLSTGLSFHHAVNAFKRRYIIAALVACDGNVSRAAQRLGIHRNTLQRDLDALKITRPRKVVRDKLAAAKAASGAGEWTSLAKTVRKGGRGESPEQPPVVQSRSSMLPRSSSSSDVTTKDHAGGFKASSCGSLTSEEETGS